MATLRGWFRDFTATTGETPAHIVFGSEHGWQTQWEEVADGQLVEFASLTDGVLDKRFDNGYGGNETPNLCAWSESWVIFADNYDGAESLRWVPRQPTAHEPIRPGGG